MARWDVTIDGEPHSLGLEPEGLEISGEESQFLPWSMISSVDYPTGFSVRIERKDRVDPLHLGFRVGAEQRAFRAALEPVEPISHVQGEAVGLTSIGSKAPRASGSTPMRNDRTIRAAGSFDIGDWAAAGMLLSVVGAVVLGVMLNEISSSTDSTQGGYLAGVIIGSLLLSVGSLTLQVAIVAKGVQLGMAAFHRD